MAAQAPAYSAALHAVLGILTQLGRTFVHTIDAPQAAALNPSLVELERDIVTWTQNCIDDRTPFARTKTVDQILETHAAYCKRINDSRD